MDLKMYVMAHKEFTMPEMACTEGFVPVQVGSALHPPIEGYLKDDSAADHISEKNANYCELTGIYHIWKNEQVEAAGICHYRRFFTRNGDILSTAQLAELLETYDVIVGNSAMTQYASLREHYQCVHNEKDLELCREVLAEKYPAYLTYFDLCMNSNFFTIGNMMVAKKEVFDAYCEWLFDILFEVERRTDLTGYDTFQARIYGYLSERLLRVWIMAHPFKVREEQVTLLE